MTPAKSTTSSGLLIRIATVAIGGMCGAIPFAAAQTLPPGQTPTAPGQPPAANGPVAPDVSGAPPPSQLSPLVYPPLVQPLAIPPRGLQFTPRASLELSYTDNVLVTNSDHKADFITSPSAGFDFLDNMSRTKIAASADTTYDFYKSTTRLDGSRLNGNADANTSLFDKLFILDARAAISQQEISPLGVTPVEQRSFGTNQTNVVNYSVTPSAQWQVGDAFKMVTKYELSAVDYFRAAASTTPIPLANSVQQSADSTLTSGSYFDRFTWTLEGTVQHNQLTGGAPSSTHQLANGTVLYLLYPNFQLAGTGGYDDIREPTLSGVTGGKYITGGFRWSLSSRTKITFDGGWRYGEPYYTGVVTYSPGRALVFHASYTETVQTAQSLAIQNLSGTLTTATGVQINPATGLAANPNADPFALNNQAYRSDTLEFGAQGVLSQNTYTAAGSYSRQQAATSTSTSFQGNVTLGRALSTHLSVNASLNYSHVQTEGIGTVPVSQTLRANVEFDYKLSQYATARLIYYFQRFTAIPALTQENGLALTLTRKF